MLLLGGGTGLERGGSRNDAEGEGRVNVVEIGLTPFDVNAAENGLMPLDVYIDAVEKGLMPFVAEEKGRWLVLVAVGEQELQQTGGKRNEVQETPSVGLYRLGDDVLLLGGGTRLEREGSAYDAEGEGTVNVVEIGLTLFDVDGAENDLTQLDVDTA